MDIRFIHSPELGIGQEKCPLVFLDIFAQSRPRFTVMYVGALRIICGVSSSFSVEFAAVQSVLGSTVVSRVAIPLSS